MCKEMERQTVEERKENNNLSVHGTCSRFDYRIIIIIKINFQKNQKNNSNSQENINKSKFVWHIRWSFVERNGLTLSRFECSLEQSFFLVDWIGLELIETVTQPIHSITRHQFLFHYQIGSTNPIINRKFKRKITFGCCKTIFSICNFSSRKGNHMK